MKSQVRLTITILIFLTSAILGQLEGFKFKELPEDSLLSIAKEIVNTDNTCTFITVDKENKPQARVLAYFPPEEDWVIRLGTSTNSRKVSQVKNNNQVMVFFYDTGGRSYVSVAGKGEIINDPELKRKYWKEGWEKYYKNPETDYVLIKVIPERLEICSYKHKLFWDETGKPAFVKF